MASEAVFDTTELLQAILSYVDAQTLWTSARCVEKKWNNAINKPIADLKRSLYLEPASQHPIHYDATSDRYFDLDMPRGIASGHVNLDRLTKEEQDFFHARNARLKRDYHEAELGREVMDLYFEPINAIELNPLFEPGNLCYFPEVYHGAERDSAWVHGTKLRLSFDPREHLGGPWEQQLVSQPPAHSIKVDVGWDFSSCRECSSVIPRHVLCDSCAGFLDRFEDEYPFFDFVGGKKLGDIVEEIEEMVEEWRYFGRKVDWARTTFYLLHATRKTDELMDMWESNTQAVRHAYVEHLATEKVQQEQEQEQEQEQDELEQSSA